MKTIKSFIIVALAVLTCGAFTACKDDANDWVVQTEGLRAWTPTKVTLTIGDTYAIISEFTTPGSTGYVVQLASNSTFTENVLEYSIPAITSAEEYTISGLTPETVYYMRIKAVCEGKEDSHWARYSHTSGDEVQYYFTTKKAGEDAGSNDD